MNEININWNWIELIITVFATAGTAFIAAFIGARLAHKSALKQKYYEKKSNVYLELSRTIPIIDDFKSQSDYFMDMKIGGSAEEKIAVLDSQISGNEIIIESLDKDNKNRRQEIEQEIRNLQYIKKKHLEYLNERKNLFNKQNFFQSKGFENELRLFASIDVWNMYVVLNVSLDNEYNTNRGIVNEDIVNNMRELIKLMRKDLQKA